jgi:hypothetical protein
MKNLGARWGWVVNPTCGLLYLWERDLVPIVQEAGWAPGQVLTGMENLTPTGIQSPDQPPHSELLYRIHYPSPPKVATASLKKVLQNQVEGIYPH